MDESWVYILDAVSMTFPTTGRTILADLSFKIEESKITAILGPSGCGKSTLLRLLAGVEQPTSGKIKPSEKTCKMFFAFQSPVLMPWLTIMENLMFPFTLKRRLRKHERKQLEDKALAILDNVGISGVADQFPNELSGGMIERVVFAQAVTYGPDVLLMDEPFSSVDAVKRYDLLQILISIWREQNLSIILVTHDIQEALAISDSIILLSYPPTGVIERIDVEKPRQSHDDLVHDDYFIGLTARILDIYREEAQRR